MISGEASGTARQVAAHRRAFARLDRPYGRPQDDLVLQADVAGDLQPAATVIGRYLAARTAFFDRFVAASSDARTAQIVSVGAGYDARSLRYEHPAVQWFELDHPDTQADKLARLVRLGIDPGGVRYASADFGVDDVAGALAAAGHVRTEPSAFLCEGVAAYLPPEVLRRLLSALGTCAADGSRLAISLSLDAPGDQSRASDPHGANGSVRRALRDAVAAIGEPLSSGLPRSGIVALLSDCGWKIHSAVDPAGVPVDRSTLASAFVIAGRGP